MCNTSRTLWPRLVITCPCRCQLIPSERNGNEPHGEISLWGRHDQWFSWKHGSCQSRLWWNKAPVKTAPKWGQREMWVSKYEIKIDVYSIKIWPNDCRSSAPYATKNPWSHIFDIEMEYTVTTEVKGSGEPYDRACCNQKQWELEGGSHCDSLHPIPI